jgi:hypothetical protein
VTDDKVDPTHYRGLLPEPIDVVEGWALGFHLGNAVKYIARAGRKLGESEIDDLRKARWYLDRAISRMEIARGNLPSTVVDRKRKAAP